MRNLVLLVLCVFIFTSFASCSIKSDNTKTEKYDENNEVKVNELEGGLYIKNYDGLTEEQISANTLESICYVIKSKNTETFKKLFSDSVIKDSTIDLDKEIRDFFEYIKGELTSFEEVKDTGIVTNGNYNRGKRYTALEYTSVISTTDGTYHVSILECTRDDRNNDIGIISLSVISGEEWNYDSVYWGVPDSIGIVIDNIAAADERERQKYEDFAQMEGFEGFMDDVEMP